MWKTRKKYNFLINKKVERRGENAHERRANSVCWCLQASVGGARLVGRIAGSAGAHRSLPVPPESKARRANKTEHLRFEREKGTLTTWLSIRLTSKNSSFAYTTRDRPLSAWAPRTASRHSRRPNCRSRRTWPSGRWSEGRSIPTRSLSRLLTAPPSTHSTRLKAFCCRNRKISSFITNSKM